MTENEYNKIIKERISKYPYSENCKLEDVIISEAGWLEVSSIGYVSWWLGETQKRFTESSREDNEVEMLNFEEMTGHKHFMRFPFAKNSIDLAIDKATGFFEERIKAIWNWSVYIAVLYLSGMKDDLECDDDTMEIIFEKNKTL